MNTHDDYVITADQCMTIVLHLYIMQSLWLIGYTLTATVYHHHRMVIIMLSFSLVLHKECYVQVDLIDLIASNVYITVETLVPRSFLL